MAPKRRSGSLLAYLETVRDSFFERDAPQNDSEFLVHDGFHLWPLGRNGLRSCCGDGACGSGRAGRNIRGTARFAGDHASFFRDDSGLPGDAVARGKTRPARGLGIFFRADAGLYRALVWKGFLFRRRRASVVFFLPFLSLFRRAEFSRFNALSAGAVPP